MKDPGQIDGKPRRRRRWLRWAALGCVLLLASAWGMQHHVAASVERHLHAVTSAPVVDCILVPGARIHADGRPYSMLADRLLGALALYRAGRAPRIIVSGRGGGGIAVDEVGAMRRYLQESGVPASAIVDDARGLRTIDSLRNVRDVFGWRSVLVVTNEFHVARAVFLGRQCGLDAHGMPAACSVHYSSYTLGKNKARELLARVRAWIDAYVLGACS